MLDALTDFAAGFAPWAQWLAVMIVAAIPFVESYFGAAIGVLVGVPVPIAIGAAIVGNIASTLAFIVVADRARRRVLAGRERSKELTPKRERLKRLFDRFGVAGVSLLGPFVLASQITASVLISLGARRSSVILWQCISIALWGIVFGLLALGGAELLSLR